MGNVYQKINAPATALIVAAVINAMFSFLVLVSGLARFAELGGRETLPVNQSERIGYLFGTLSGYGFALASLVLSPFVIYAAVQMKNYKKYKSAKAAAILTIIPLTSCCFLVGIPIGIWALIVLNNPEVKAVFDGRYSPNDSMPPPPPNF